MFKMFFLKLLSIVSNKKHIWSFLALNCLTPPKRAKTFIHYFVIYFVSDRKNLIIFEILVYHIHGNNFFQWQLKLTHVIDCFK